MLQKFIKITSNLEQTENTKERKKTKRLASNKKKKKKKKKKINLYKPALNKIITTQAQCVKYNFVAPLSMYVLFLPLELKG